MGIKVISDYEILNVGENATLEEIRRAYKLLVFRYHPDRNPDVTSLEKFKIINAAYERLTKKLTPDYEIPELEHTNQIKQGNKLTVVCNRKRQTFYSNSFLSFTDEKINNRINSGEEKYSHEKISQLLSSKPTSINKRALVWKAEKEGWGTIYLFGTFHIPFKLEDRFNDLIDKLLDDVEIVQTELELQIGFLNVCTRQQRFTFVLDHFIAEKAYLRGKKLMALEDERVRGLINPQLCHPEVVSKRLKDLKKEAWEMLSQNFDEDEIFEVTTRNKFWMEQILDISRSGQNSLVAAGGLHTISKFSLQNLLELEGYTCTPIVEKTPPSKREIVRQLAIGQNFFFFDQPKLSLSRLQEKHRPIVPAAVVVSHLASPAP